MTSPIVPKSRQLRLQESFALIGGFGLFAWLLFTTIASGPAPAVHPIFPLAALVFFLYPFRREIVARRLLQLSVLIFVIWMFVSLSGVLTPFIVAFILAYLTEPLVGWLHKKVKIPRWLSAMVIVLSAIGILVMIGLFLVPKVIEQFNQLLGSAQGLVKDANSLFDQRKMTQLLDDNGIPHAQSQQIVAQIQPQIKAAAAWLFSGLDDVLKNVASVVESVFNLIIIPMLWFYLLMDFDRLKRNIRDTLMRMNVRAMHYAREVDVIVISYLRGISITSSLVGVLATITFSILDLPFAIIIGVLTGVFNLIPSVGMFLNLGVAMIIFLFAPGSFWSHTLVTAITIAGLHILNSYFIEPRVLGDRVGLHPVVLIASLFIFAYFLGFIGLLIAVPTAAVILRFLQEWFRYSFPSNSSVGTVTTPETL